MHNWTIGIRLRDVATHGRSLASRPTSPYVLLRHDGGLRIAPLATALLLISTLLACDCNAADFELWHVDSTGTQIAIAWDPVNEAADYVVERDIDASFNSVNHVSYDLSEAVTAFGDTGWPTTDSRRFRVPSSPANSPAYHLDRATDYYYRVVASKPGGDLTSNTIGPLRLTSFTDPSQITRGEAGDLWADAVLGQPSFGENSWWKTDPFFVQSPGGVVVDRNTSHPTHVFIVDGNRNRILGMSSLGRCSISEAPCSIDTDCDGALCNLTPGEVGPDFVLGQPSATDEGACNGDGTGQLFPDRAAPTAATLCLMKPDQISVGETVISIQIAVDSEHNVYVPDQWNNRVLKYRDPFDPTNGTAAESVWGASRPGDWS